MSDIENGMESFSFTTCPKSDTVVLSWYPTFQFSCHQAAPILGPFVWNMSHFIPQTFGRSTVPLKKIEMDIYWMSHTAPSGWL